MPSDIADVKKLGFMQGCNRSRMFRSKPDFGSMLTKLLYCTPYLLNFYYNCWTVFWVWKYLLREDSKAAANYRRKNCCFSTTIGSIHDTNSCVCRN